MRSVVRLPNRNASTQAADTACRKDGRKCCAAHAHIEAENEYGIQHDVARCADEHGKHADLCIALCGNKRIEAQRKLHENGAKRINAHVFACELDGVFRCAECEQQLIPPDGEHRGEHSRNKQQQRKAVPKNAFRRGIVPFSHADGSTWGSPHAHKRRKCGNQHDQRHANPHAGQGKGTRFGNMADVNAVHQVIKHVYKLRRHGRQCKAEEQLADPFGAKESIVVLHKVRSPVFSLNVFRNNPQHPPKLRAFRFTQAA